MSAADLAEDPQDLAAAPPAGPGTEAERVKVSVDNGHCHLFGLCQQEAPNVFDLGPDGRLRYQASPPASETPRAVHAARICPMQAITVTRRAR